MARVNLASIVAAANAGTFAYVNPNAPQVKKMISDGDIEVNDQMVNPENEKEVAARPTPQGIAKMNTNSDSSAETFAIESVSSNVVESSKRGGRPDTYPFDKLPAPTGDGNYPAFFVPATEKRPKPWESLASTVSAANRRYATVTGTKDYQTAKGETKQRNVYDYERRFKITEGEKDGNKGAWVARTK